MLQQLHGVTMYSHDEHHTSAPYCWSERGKGASATNPSTAVLLIITRPSVSQYVSPSCGPVSCKKCVFARLVPSQYPGGRIMSFFNQIFFNVNQTKNAHTSELSQFYFARLASCAGFCTHLLHKSALWVTLGRECSAAHFLILNNSEMQ